MRTAALPGVLAVCACLLAAAPAVAGDKAEAQKHFKTGLALMKVEDFAGAAAEFEASVATFPTKTGLFNLANCYKALQRYGDALAVIDRLKRDFASKLKPEIKEAVERQEREIQSLVARLTLETVPADASIKIDGKDVGTGPTLGPLLLGPGEHEIEAARPGHHSQRRSVKLVSGAGQTEKFVLEAEAGSLVVRANVAGAAVFVDSA
jgi:outer membrane receptor for ferrienterochelin and colicins